MFKTGDAAGSVGGTTSATDTFGAVVVCTGGREHVPDGLMHGKDARVLTQLEFGKALASGEVAKTLGEAGTAASAGAASSGVPATAGTAPSVVMVQCVGSRSSDWPVCSRVCCAQALRNALAVKKARPDARVTIVHRDIRVYGLEEELLTEALEKGIELVGVKDSAALVLRGTSVEVSPAPSKSGEQPGGKPLNVTFRREGAAAQETLNADYAILSTSLRPSPESGPLAEVLGIEIDSNGFFKELHPKLRPVETSRKGVYICGLAHSSQTVQETITQAMAAAEKASSALGHAT